MRTADLIPELAKHAEPVAMNRVPARLGLSLAVGALGVLALQLQTAGIRPDVTTAWAFVGAKLAAITIIAAAWFWLVRQLATPGSARRTQWLLALGLAGAVAFMAVMTPRLDGLMGCVSQVLLLVLPVFLALTIGLRCCAPTNLTETGLAAGILAGALAASGYSLGCTVDDPAVVAFRYGIAILLCGVIGALAGRTVLRW